MTTDEQCAEYICEGNWVALASLYLSPVAHLIQGAGDNYVHVLAARLEKDFTRATEELCQSSERSPSL